MTVKEYLEQFKDWNKEIVMNIKQLKELYDIWPQTTAPTNTQNRHDLDADFVVLEQLHKTEIKRLLQQKYDLLLIINSLDYSLLRIILTEKYINLKQPENIAAEVPCDVRTVYRWLNEGINTIQTQHPDLFETDKC